MSANPDAKNFTYHFHEILAHELAHVEARRKAVGLTDAAAGDHAVKVADAARPAKDIATVPPDPDKAKVLDEAVAGVRDQAKRMDLFGVSFSGGGIRSATFSLGILQALGKLKLLRHVDYLSTVSGGGYIGGWLAAWVRREADGLSQPPFDTAPATGQAVLDNIERQLDPDRAVQARTKRLSNHGTPGAEKPEDRPFVRPRFAEDREPSPIHHLRAHSRFLSPRVGLLSLDTWALFAIYTRNLFVNALIFVPLLAFVILAVRLAARAYSCGVPANPSYSGWAFGLFCVALVAMRFGVDRGLVVVRRRHSDNGNRPTNPIRMATFSLLVASGLWALAPAHPGEQQLRQVSVALAASEQLVIATGAWPLVSPQFDNVGTPATAGVPSRMPTEFRPTKTGQADVLGRAAQYVPWGNRWLAPHSSNGYIRGAFLFGGLSLISLASLVCGSAVMWPLRQENNPARRNSIRNWVARHRRATFAAAAAVAAAVPIVVAILAANEQLTLEDTLGPLAVVALVTADVLFALLVAITLLGLVSIFRPVNHALTWLVRGFTSVFFGVVLGLLATVIVNEFLYMGTSQPALFAAFGPPLFLLAIWVAGFAEVAVGGGWFTDYEREWRSRIGAWLLLTAVAWATVFAVVVYLPQLLDNRGGTAATGGAVALTAVLRFLVPRLSKSPGLMAWVAVKVVPIVFLVALLALVASGVDRIVHQFPSDESRALEAVKQKAPPEVRGFDLQQARVPNPAPASGDIVVRSVKWVESPHGAELTYADWLEVGSWEALAVGGGIAFTLFTVFILVVPVNRFSLHSLYANRLIRGYLGASLRPAHAHLGRRTCVPTAACEQRRANAFSGFDPNDDLPLVTLRADLVVKDGEKAASLPYVGPLPLFNTTLNMVMGSELAYQDRKGDSFVLSPYYCGSFATGYARLHGGEQPARSDLDDALSRYWNLTVGRAITASGAAVDPNMAVYYSEQFTAFLTIMNARLGWWMRNPSRPDGENGPWDASPPAGSLRYLMEMAGYTSAEARNVHLSDGGHFENTGAYELIRRRCRFVLLVDAAENTDTTSENLANLVRRVHADLGIRIQIDTTPLRKGGADGRTSDWHCAIGAIRYDDVDAGGVIGTLLFVRSSLTGDEPPDIRNYASANPEFPHHPTAHQFFDEAQFESYRGLGYHIGLSALREAADALPERSDRRFLRRLFGKLRRQWTSCSAFQREQYLQSCSEYLEQVDHVGGSHTEVARKLQLMENAWLRNDLDHSYAHPIQRGWVNVFRQWSTDLEFQRAWPLLRGAFSQGFVAFCERALSVNRPSVLLLPGGFEQLAGPWGEIVQEFGSEMLSFFASARGADAYARQPELFLPSMIQKCVKFWLIGSGDPTERDGIVSDPGLFKHVVGFVAVFDPIIPDSTPANGTRAGEYEFLLWLRGPFRMAGIGAAAMRSLFRESTGPLHGMCPLFARFPINGSGPAEQMQRATWVQFMNDFDFYGVPQEGHDWERNEVRVRYHG